jgi:hypothetical protein
MSGGLLSLSLNAPGASDGVVLTDQNSLSISGGSLNLVLASGGAAFAGTYTLVDYSGAALSDAQLAELNVISGSYFGTNNNRGTLRNNAVNTSIGDNWR